MAVDLALAGPAEQAVQAVVAVVVGPSLAAPVWAGLAWAAPELVALGEVVAEVDLA